MKSRILVCLTAALVALGIGVSAQRSSTDAGPLSEEHENERIVMRGVTACGVERWSVKTGTDHDASKVNTKGTIPTTIIHLRSLPAPSSPPLKSRVKPTELSVFQITGTLLRIKQESDSDFHLVIADAGGRTMITEAPAPQCVGSSSPFTHQINYVRSQLTSKYHPGKEWQRPNQKVTIRGVAFFDFKHGQSGVAPNAIELHPILGFKVGGGTIPAPPSTPGASPRPTPSSAAHAGNFTVKAYVLPQSMKNGAHPTLYAQTLQGARCTASVIYSTHRAPRGFKGTAQTVGSSGKVHWSWHEETSGSGGTATVKCSYAGETKTATAHFTVTG
jgi:hypothetical protein